MMLDASNIKVSVIVPIYKVENYILKCAVSLFRQSLQEVEYIFVNDCTPDSSMKLLHKCIEQFSNRKSNVLIFNHEINKGLPDARNTGLLHARGEYVFHCDSDDFVESLMLEEMYSCAKLKNADIVWADWFLSYEQNERYMSQPSFFTAEDALFGILKGSMKYNVWNKLVSRDLYYKNNILFPAGHSMGEDMTMIKLFACAKEVAYVNKAFYHYVKTNTFALTNSLSDKQISDIKYNVDDVVSFLRKNLCNPFLEKGIAFFKLSVKLPLIISDKKSDYELWNSLYEEANVYIFKNSASPLRIKLLQWFAYKKMYTIVKIYYILVYKFIYRLIFK